METISKTSAGASANGWKNKRYIMGPMGTIKQSVNAIWAIIGISDNDKLFSKAIMITA